MTPGQRGKHRDGDNTAARGECSELLHAAGASLLEASHSPPPPRASRGRRLRQARRSHQHDVSVRVASILAENNDNTATRQRREIYSRRVTPCARDGVYPRPVTLHAMAYHAGSVVAIELQDRRASPKSRREARARIQTKHRRAKALEQKLSLLFERETYLAGRKRESTNSKVLWVGV